MQINPKRVSDDIINFLVESGVTTFFGIPGGPVSPLFDSILRCQKAQLIESRQETAAAFAAATYFEETGKIAAVVVTAGPGGTNAVTGITSAFLKRIPVLLICGDVAWADKGERLIQDCGPQGIHMESIFASVTRKTIRIQQPQSACAHFSLALESCKNPISPGPVLVMLPMQIATRPSFGLAPIPRVDTAVPTTPLKRGVINEVRSLLKESHKPLIVIGNGCRGVKDLLIELLDITGIPFVTTPQAKGLLPEDHSLSLRNGGLAASWWARKYVNEGDDIDVCLALGTDLDDCATGPTKYVRTSTKLIHVDVDAAVFNRNFNCFLSLRTELASFIQELILATAEEPVLNILWRLAVDDIKMRSPFDQPDFRNDNSRLISPHRAIADIQSVMPDDTRYISDIGEHMLFALHYLTIKNSDTFYLHLNLGSMGSGIAGALGLAIGNPHKPVVCICGDGGMQMMGMEILVAKKLGLPIIYAIFNDARYNMVYHGFKTLYGYTHGWDTPPVDFSKWAESMNINAFTIRQPGDLKQFMVTTCLEQSQPLVLDIHIDKEVRISGAGRNEHLQHMSVGKTLLNEVE